MKGTKPAKQLASAERQERLLRIIELYTLGERCSLTDYQLARLARVPRWSVSPALRALERARRIRRHMRHVVPAVWQAGAPVRSERFIEVLDER
jgi:hypothetical protein